uniref:Uncharacterized protein n=1 Tax=Nelumbo nucifera TaxID=4432 RepID=A0A822Z6W3_NELNU|nr:TPA_asm: hypothetical protein HUJ06_007929 [Nelumbo nucifera]
MVVSGEKGVKVVVVLGEKEAEVAGFRWTQCFFKKVLLIY